MKRRGFIMALGSAAAAWPLAALTQQSPKPARLGYFAPAANAVLLDALRTGLRDLGYVEHRNLAIDYRYADRSKTYDEFGGGNLVHLGPDVIVAVGTPPALAAKRQTATIPIIMAPAADPVRTGLVGSLPDPAGTLAVSRSTALNLPASGWKYLGRRWRALGASRFSGMLEILLHRFLWDDLQPVGPTLGLEFRLVSILDLNELSTAFSSMKRENFDALTLLSDAQFFSQRRQIGELAMLHRLPSVHEAREFVEGGGLLSYGPNIPDLTRRAAAFVAKVLNGVKAADLPVEQPTKLELVINLKTAKALGLTVPPSLLARADEVIE